MDNDYYDTHGMSHEASEGESQVADRKVARKDQADRKEGDSKAGKKWKAVSQA